MKTKAILFFFSFILFISCESSEENTQVDEDVIITGLQTKTFSHDNVNRNYLVYIPNSYDSEIDYPLMFLFHGFGGIANQFINSADMRDLAESQNFIVVYPQGLDLAGTGSHWNCSNPSADNKSDVDDIGFIENLIDQLILDYPVIDSKRNSIYVSDSFGFNEKGIGLYKFDLTSGEGGPCSEELFNFANGMCLSPDGNYLYVVESFHPCVSRLPINDDGSFGKKEIFTEDIAIVPDGLAFDKDNNLFISCYEPSRIYMADTKGNTKLLIEDKHCTTMAHPTNIAISEDGNTMYTANLGRWHITEIDISSLYLSLIHI